MFHPLENYHGTSHPKIFEAAPRQQSAALVATQLARATEAVQRFDEEALRRCVAALLPTFRWDSGEPAHIAEVVPLQRGSDDVA